MGNALDCSGGRDNDGGSSARENARLRDELQRAQALIASLRGGRGAGKDTAACTAEAAEAEGMRKDPGASGRGSFRYPVRSSAVARLGSNPMAEKNSAFAKKRLLESALASGEPDADNEDHKRAANFSLDANPEEDGASSPPPLSEAEKAALYAQMKEAEEHTEGRDGQKTEHLLQMASGAATKKNKKKKKKIGGRGRAASKK
jgi:hypothetical protein